MSSAHEQPAVERRRHGTHRVLVEPHALGDVGVIGEHCAAKHVTVAAEELGRAVNHEVGAAFERTLQHRAREGAVDRDQCSRGVCELADRIEIHDAQQGIGR